MPNKLSVVVLAYSPALEYLFPFYLWWRHLPHLLSTISIHRLNPHFLSIMFVIYLIFSWWFTWFMDSFIFFIRLLRWVGMGVRGIQLCTAPAKFLGLCGQWKITSHSLFHFHVFSCLFNFLWHLGTQGCNGPLSFWDVQWKGLKEDIVQTWLP